jgi:hypothetical protein
MCNVKSGTECRGGCGVAEEGTSLVSRDCSEAGDRYSLGATLSMYMIPL